MMKTNGGQVVSLCMCVCVYRRIDTNISAERNALRSACVIINGCQRLFSGRRRWQTALQKRRECVNASQRVDEGGGGRQGCSECNIPHSSLQQMIQVTKPGISPSFTAIWGIPGHLCKLCESDNDLSTPTSQQYTHCKILCVCVCVCKIGEYLVREIL